MERLGRSNGPTQFQKPNGLVGDNDVVEHERQFANFTLHSCHFVHLLIILFFGKENQLQQDIIIQETFCQYLFFY
jgi:hypothetical protein